MQDNSRTYVLKGHETYLEVKWDINEFACEGHKNPY
jgi:hypothetical protein